MGEDRLSIELCYGCRAFTDDRKRGGVASSGVKLSHRSQSWRGALTVADELWQLVRGGYDDAGELSCQTIAGCLHHSLLSSPVRQEGAGPVRSLEACEFGSFRWCEYRVEHFRRLGGTVYRFYVDTDLRMPDECDGHSVTGV
ncbi:hypothetical protein GCM10027569_82830 [Flindersiella endophytica]